MIVILHLDWTSDSWYFLMTTLEGVSYSSFSRLEQEGGKVQCAVANDKITSSSIKDYSTGYPFEGSLDGGFDSSDDSFNYGQNSYPPEVNLKNVLGGMVAILTGRNKPLGGTENTKSPSSNLTFIGSEEKGDTLLPSSVYIPGSPPLLEPNGNDYIAYKDVLEAEPPEWLPDSSARFCMQCTATFTALTRGRHHCRFCGGVFCRSCTKGRCLLPVKFRERNPQRVCDVCYDRLDPLQSVLINSISNAVQGAKHDVIDWTCGRGWFNLPIGLSMEYEIYKASNTLRSYSQVAKSSPDRSIPLAVLREAKGLAILTVAKAGLMVTYKLGTGLVIAQRSDKTWSAPSAIVSAGLGWGAQIGGEITDFIIVLHDLKAVKTFCSRMHISLGAGCSAATGPIGRVLEADIRTGDRGSGMCYTYSRSKGAFVGMSLEGNFVATRMDMNLQFYGDPYLTTSDILLGTVKRPKAAEPLYAAVNDLYASL